MLVTNFTEHLGGIQKRGRVNQKCSKPLDGHICPYAKQSVSDRPPILPPQNDGKREQISAHRSNMLPQFPLALHGKKLLDLGNIERAIGLLDLLIHLQSGLHARIRLGL